MVLCWLRSARLVLNPKLRLPENLVVVAGSGEELSSRKGSCRDGNFIMTQSCSD